MNTIVMFPQGALDGATAILVCRVVFETAARRL
jgi:hypothetical protein